MQDGRAGEMRAQETTTTTRSNSGARAGMMHVCTAWAAHGILLHTSLTFLSFRFGHGPPSSTHAPSSRDHRDRERERGKGREASAWRCVSTNERASGRATGQRGRSQRAKTHNDVGNERRTNDDDDQGSAVHAQTSACAISIAH
jgi:hypothetical protein